MQLLVNQLEPLTEQQVMGIINLQQSSQQAEDALSQGMDALQQSLAETLANNSSNPSGSSGNVANYMGQMAMAMGKLGTLEGFLRQVIHCLLVSLSDSGVSKFLSNCTLSSEEIRSLELKKGEPENLSSSINNWHKNRTYYLVSFVK